MYRSHCWSLPTACPAGRAGEERGLAAWSRRRWLGAYHHAPYGFLDPRLVYGRRPGWRSAVWRPACRPAVRSGVRPLVYAPVFALGLLALPRLWIGRREARLPGAAGDCALHRGAWHMGGVVSAHRLGSWFRARPTGGGAALKKGPWAVLPCSGFQLVHWRCRTAEPRLASRPGWNCALLPHLVGRRRDYGCSWLRPRRVLRDRRALTLAGRRRWFRRLARRNPRLSAARWLRWSAGWRSPWASPPGVDGQDRRARGRHAGGPAVALPTLPALAGWRGGGPGPCLGTRLRAAPVRAEAEVGKPARAAAGSYSIPSGRALGPGPAILELRPLSPGAKPI
jgi:hypothetical protein